jgi:pullulanase
MKAFIDDLCTVRIEYEGYIEDVILLDKPLQWKTTEGFFQWFVSGEPISLQKADVIFINGIKIPLQIGIVTLTDLFEETFRYDGPLGAVYTKDYTDFYLYTPIAKEVKLVLNDTVYNMQGDSVIYHVRVSGDHAYMPYYYEVRLVDTFVKTLDPYVNLTNHIDGFINPNMLKAKPHTLKPLKKTETFIY